MTFDWSSRTNRLLLNPRLPSEQRARVENAFNEQGGSSGQQALIGLMTSGSSSETGLGRLILHSLDGLLASAEAVNRHFSSRASDVWMKTLPEFHVGGLGIWARAHLSGAKVVESALVKWQAREFAEALQASRATLVSLVPTQLYDLVNVPMRCPPSVRAVIVGGAHLDSEIERRALELGWPIHTSYGLTESGSQVATSLTPGDRKLVPLSHVDIRVNQQGLIELRGPSLLVGQIEFTERGSTFTDPKRDGWLTTEDRGRLQSDGSLEVFGRGSDFVKIGGEGVNLVKLQALLARRCELIGLVEEIWLTAVRDERLGAKIILITTLPESEAVALRDWFNSEVLPFERIRLICNVDEFPRSALGKVLRRRLLQELGFEPVSHD